MTDNSSPKFFNPETGEEMHRVPKGAQITPTEPVGVNDREGRFWYPKGLGMYYMVNTQTRSHKEETA